MKKMFVFLMLCVFFCNFATEPAVADDATTTSQMRYVNQFFNVDGSYTQLGLDLCKWLDMNRRDKFSRNNSGYLMLEEEYEYHQDTLFQGSFVLAANKAMETISSLGVNLALDFANHQLMKDKFGDAGALAVPYYEYFAEIYLSFVQGLEREMSTMDIALDTIIELVGNGVEMTLEDGLPTIVKQIKQSDLWLSLTVDQKYALDKVDKLMNRKFPPLQKYQQMIDKIGIAFDFAGTAASWIDVFETKENLSIQQQLYMAAFSQVTDDHLETLLNLQKNLQKQSSLSSDERKKIDGAIGALVCDIYAARNNHMEAAAQADWNVKLGTYKSLSNAIYATAEFGVALSGLDDILSVGTTAKGLSAITAVAETGEFILSLATQDSLDVREQTKVIYNLKRTMVERIELLLAEYTIDPTHERAVEIIACLKLLKQAKFSGEEMITLFYLAQEADSFGLANSPAALAILWNELISEVSINQVDFNAAAYTQPICTVYENSVAITGYHYDANLHNGTVRYKVISTPVSYYAWPSTNATDVRYQGVALDMLPASIMSKISANKWTPTTNYLKKATLTPKTAMMTIQDAGREYEHDAKSRISKDELEKLADKDDVASASSLYDARIHREKEYVYSRGAVEVRISADEYEKYLAAEAKVEQLLIDYISVSALDYASHQAEERLKWTWVTHKYIESFPMFDPSNDYGMPEEYVTPEDDESALDSAETSLEGNDGNAQPSVQPNVADADWSNPYKTVVSKGNQNAKNGTRIDAELFGKVLRVRDQVGGWFYFVAPVDGNYSFSVLAPKLRRASFSIEVYEYVSGNKQHRDKLRFEKSNQIQTQTIYNVKAGTSIYWWDNDDSGRWYTLTDSFALMITYDGMERNENPIVAAGGAIQVGDEFIFGSYEQDANTKNGKELIDWIVVSIDTSSETVIALSKYCLDVEVYNKKTKRTPWGKSHMRNWLNEDFYNVAFSPEEQKTIVETKVDGSNDYVFLLDKKQVYSYLSNKKCSATDYAKERGVFVDDDDMSSWWVRKSETTTYGVYVGSLGGVRDNNNKVTTKDNGIRPAITLPLSFFITEGHFAN